MTLECAPEEAEMWMVSGFADFGEWERLASDLTEEKARNLVAVWRAAVGRPTPPEAP